jgi:hypothetical protein
MDQARPCGELCGLRPHSVLRISGKSHAKCQPLTEDRLAQNPISTKLPTDAQAGQLALLWTAARQLPDAESARRTGRDNAHTPFDSARAPRPLSKGTAPKWNQPIGSAWNGTYGNRAVEDTRANYAGRAAKPPALAQQPAAQPFFDARRRWLSAQEQARISAQRVMKRG